MSTTTAALALLVSAQANTSAATKQNRRRMAGPNSLQNIVSTYHQVLVNQLPRPEFLYRIFRRSAWSAFLA
jgi:hypothetical protein